MVTMSEKRTALVAVLKTLLKTHNEHWKVDTRMTNLILFGGSKAARNEVMGSPVRYVLVAHTGMAFLEAAENAVDLAGRAFDQADQFTVQMWLQFDDTELQVDSSQAEWEGTMLDKDDGIMYKLLDDEWLEDAGSGAAMSAPTDINFDLLSLSSAGRELAHYVTFAITVT